jgi:zinc transport system ATP-binding protein
MEPVVEVRNLTVVLDGERVVDHLSFTLPRAKMTAVVGPNGAGKTTLLRALLGLVRYEGEITWQPGVSISYVPQRFSVPASAPITVLEFFLLKAAGFWWPRKSFVDEVARELGQVGLGRHVLDKPLGRLSGGELQRLLLVWALLKRPDVLLFDEPTASVDVGFAETIYAIMHRLTQERGTTILLISHDLNVVFRYVTNVLCLNRQLFCQGPPTEALTPAEMKHLFGEVAFFRHGIHGE